ncbi:uncharacterized protein LOC133707474 isoform X2 [Rosa rugosa]|uniref:uncharacterized protein LOC133707474 isoform X2 n=1 Tax=Rosa rugosa TaxID=74645 RepID=UPI002B403E13|nr:uncharacterized protein LOC133707474 isoform X2 [Rosa rugosa]
MTHYSFLYSFTFVPSLYEVFILHECLLQYQNQHRLNLPLFQTCRKAMAAVVNLSSIAPSQRMCFKPMAGPAIGSLTIKRTCKFVRQNRADAKPHSIYVKRKAEKNLSNISGLFPIMAARGISTFSSGSLSPSDTINDFYKCINEKNLKQLGHYISSECCIEECSFSTPLQGKKVIMNFFEELTAAMGNNIKFSIQHVCEGGDQLTAAANWHMEWKDKQIPFTRGCSFFEYSKEGEKLIIKKAQIVIESPIKPGHLVLSLLKAVTSLFDGFPRATECK